MERSLIKYIAAGMSFGLSALILSSTSKLDIPECSNDKVLSSVIVLWKSESLKAEEPILNGRLKEPIELPLRISGGRVCSAELTVDGRSSGSISYSVMRPIKGGANMVNID